MNTTGLKELMKWINSNRNTVTLNKIIDKGEELLEQEASDICQNVSGCFLPKCTRVEVIDQSGRAYVNWKPTNKVETMMQDDNRTLKVFIG